MPSVSSSSGHAKKKDNCAGMDSTVGSSSIHDMSNKEIIVISPPPQNPTDFEVNSPLPEILEDSDSETQEKADVKPNSSRKFKISRDDSTIEDNVHSLLGTSDQAGKLTASRSCHNIASHDEDSSKVSFHLTIPEALKSQRSFSTEFEKTDAVHTRQEKVAEKVKKTKSMPRSGIPSLSTKHFFDVSPREGRKGTHLSRTRSQSPVIPSFMRSLSGKTSPDNPRTAPWPNPLRFLSRKPSGTPASTTSAQTEFTWMEINVSF